MTATIFGISIPSGAIKRLNCMKVRTACILISIPSGAIKSQKAGQNFTI